MKSLLAVVSLAALGGCVVAPPGPAYYGSRPAEPFDPYQWHTVSSQPTSRSRVEYTSEPVYSQRTYVPAPMYVQQPVYVPQPYYYPPVSIGLDFVFGWRGGRHGGHGHGGRGHYRGR